MTALKEILANPSHSHRNEKQRTNYWGMNSDPPLLLPKEHWLIPPPAPSPGNKILTNPYFTQINFDLSIPIQKQFGSIPPALDQTLPISTTPKIILPNSALLWRNLTSPDPLKSYRMGNSDCSSLIKFWPILNTRGIFTNPALSWRNSAQSHPLFQQLLMKNRPVFPYS